jgi:hypothetical protein
MPNEADMADQTIELELQASLTAVRARRAPDLVPKGMCHNCDSEVEPGKLFCAAVAEGPGLSECQEDYERRVRRGRV